MTPTSLVILLIAAACSIGALGYAYATTGNPAAAGLLLATDAGVTVWLVRLLRGSVR